MKVLMFNLVKYVSYGSSWMTRLQTLCLWYHKALNIHYTLSFFNIGTIFSPQSGMQSDIQVLVANICCNQSCILSYLNTSCVIFQHFCSLCYALVAIATAPKPILYAGNILINLDDDSATLDGDGSTLIRNEAIEPHDEWRGRKSVSTWLMK